MRTIISTRHPQFAVSSLILVMLWLGGCASTPEPEPEPIKPLAPEQVQPEVPQRVSLVLPPSAYRAQLDEAERLLKQYRWMAASTVLDTIPKDQTSVDDLVYLGYLQARIAYIRGQQQAALEQLAALDYPGVNPALHYRMLNFRRNILSLAGDNLAAAQLGQRLLPMAPKTELPQLKRDIWVALAQVDSPDLQSALQQARLPFLPTPPAPQQETDAAASDTVIVTPPPPTPTAAQLQWQGWLELALLSREDLPNLASRLPQWLQAHPGHPASQPLPGGMGFLLDAASPSPTSIALLLPLSGELAPAGKAVRDGYLASYYAGRAAGTANWDVLVLDVNGYDSTTHAYRDALNKGAKMVVGPLSKQAVGELANNPRPAPILALNRADGLAASEQEEAAPTATPTPTPIPIPIPIPAANTSTQAPDANGLGITTNPTPGLAPVHNSSLVQFSLAPEDEAYSLAERAFGQGGRSALIIRPVGDWGDKMSQALLERWSQLGGVVANNVAYSGREEYSPSVKEGLGIPTSEQRARDIGDMLSAEVEFTARRRQDVDVVFLLARNGAEARSLKPLLAFHYAGNLPIYATSSIYNGVASASDRDLDDINLVEMPWLLGSSPKTRAELAAGNTGTYTRLNALGADAYLLQSRFRQLQAGPDALLRGNTGLLTLNRDLQVERELPLATFDEGVIESQ